MEVGRQGLARGRGSRDRKNAGADHGADAEGRQAPRPQRFAQPLAGVFRCGDQPVNALAAKELIHGVAKWR